MLALELLFGRFQQSDERLTGPLRKHVRRQRYVEGPSPQDGVPGLSGSAESQSQRRRAPGLPRGIRTTTEARRPETCCSNRPRWRCTLNVYYSSSLCNTKSNQELENKTTELSAIVFVFAADNARERGAVKETGKVKHGQSRICTIRIKKCPSSFWSTSGFAGNATMFQFKRNIFRIIRHVVISVDFHFCLLTKVSTR
jgi:hypothetical protein